MCNTKGILFVVVQVEKLVSPNSDYYDAIAFTYYQQFHLHSQVYTKPSPCQGNGVSWVGLLFLMLWHFVSTHWTRLMFEFAKMPKRSTPNHTWNSYWIQLNLSQVKKTTLGFESELQYCVSSWFGEKKHIFGCSEESHHKGILIMVPLFDCFFCIGNCVANGGSGICTREPGCAERRLANWSRPT